MSAIQFFCILSTILFIFLSIFLSSNHWITLTLKVIAIVMSIFGVFVTASVLGIVTSGAVRLI